MFVGMGLSAVVPVLHGLQIYSVREMRDRIGLSWLLLQGFLYILGAGLYAVSVVHNTCLDRNLIPLGSMARTGCSRILRYMGKFPSDLPYIGSHGSRITPVRLTSSFRLSPWGHWEGVLERIVL